MKVIRRTLGLATLLLAVFALTGGSVAAQEKPNIILINLDDADMEIFSESNLTQRFPNLNLLAQRSVKFNNTHATTPLCGPSRACLLRAQYAHHSGIKVNVPDVPNAFGFDGGMRRYFERGYDKNDLSTWMQDAGYHTIQIGKYLHADTVFALPAGWDDFYSSLGARYFSTYRITNRNKLGRPESETIADGLYRTNVETADAVELINRRADADDGKPFFMYLNSLGPHVQLRGSGEMFDPRYADLWPDARRPQTDAYDQADISNRVGPIGELPPLTLSTENYLRTHYRDRLLAMRSVDDMVGSVVETLRDRDLEDNTYIILTSDNGFSLGEHRLFAKSIHMDVATRVPLMVAGPGVTPDSSDHLLAHIDIGPTIVELAGGTVPDFVDGVSFVPLIANPNQAAGVRDSVLIENFQTRAAGPGVGQYSSTGLQLKDASYIEWADGGREYFDLKNDPDQLRNVYNTTPLSERRMLAAWLRTTKARFPSNASFHSPYYDLDELSEPVLEGIAESTVAVRYARISLRDLSTGKFWNGDEWVSQFSQVEPQLSQGNGMLTTWRYPLEFSHEQRPAGLMKAWVWGIDFANNYEAPDTVVFRLAAVEPEVTLESPFFEQRFDSVAELFGDAVDGDNNSLERVRLIIRDANVGTYWNGRGFQTSVRELTVDRDGERWSYTSKLRRGTYRVSVAGIDGDGKVFNEIQRLFFVD